MKINWNKNILIIAATDNERHTRGFRDDSRGICTHARNNIECRVCNPLIELKTGILQRTICKEE